ncbi:hypothetical protein YC2023_058449 [Brassica napus]
MTSFPARPLRSGFYVEVIRRVAADVYKLAGFLKTLEYWQRDKFWDLVSRFLILCLEMLETSALGLGQDLGLLLVLEGAMTNSTYVSHFSFILIPYRFKVRDRFSAYTISLLSLCRMYESHLYEMAKSSSRRICFEKILVRMTFWSSKKVFLSGRKFRRRTNLQASATSRDAEDLLFFRMPRFVHEMFAGLKMFRDVARD